MARRRLVPFGTSISFFSLTNLTLGMGELIRRAGRRVKSLGWVPMDHRVADYWSESYRRGDTGWQLPAVAPPIARLLDEEKAARLVPGHVAVVGCGRSHEPSELARRGFRVLGVDFSPAG